MTADARVVLVTGGSSGIGRAVAEQAAGRGWHLVLAARDLDALDETAACCRLLGAASVAVRPVDVGDDARVADLIANVTALHDRLDAVVHAAGVVAYGRLEEVPAKVFEGVLRTNLVGSANVARQALPVFRRQQGGHLVLVGSVLGHIAVPNMTPYIVAKWGVRALARQVQLETRDVPGVHVSHVAPGSVDTPIYGIGGNYLGVRTLPPPPVLTPERVAAAILRDLDHPRQRVQVGWANDLMRFGFTTLPWLYDALVGPLQTLAGLDACERQAVGPGSVLSPVPGGHGLRGGYGNGLAAVMRKALRLTNRRGAWSES